MILAFDTTSSICSVSIFDGKEIITLREEGGFKHSTLLMPLIDRILKENNYTTKDIEKIVVSNGPGSFTGVRIGVATALGFKKGLGVPIYSVNTLDMMSYSSDDDIRFSIINARRHSVYAAGYGKKILKSFNDDFDVIKSFLEGIVEKVTFIGENISEFSEEVRTQLNISVKEVKSIGSEGIILSYLDGKFSEDISPNYMRKTLAEMERNL